MKRSLKTRRKGIRKLVASASSATAGTLLRSAAAAAIPNRMMGRTAITKILVIMILK